MQCPTCGSLAGRWRGPCGSCGERASLRAFGRLAFAEDPTAPPLDRTARPAELASPQARIIAAALDLTLAGVALLWTGTIGADLAFAHHTSLAHQLVRALTWLAVVVTPLLMEATDGQTFGKRIVGIRVVGRETGGPIGLREAVHRGGARALFWFVTFLALGDPLLQPLHDRSAGTVVINAGAYGWVPPPDSAIRAH
ncbi:MAG TPA: RDD family protein [Acidimicrobiia bacterium]|nr:RDD family protein [Acidimicrobiia bacterium]